MKRARTARTVFVALNTAILLGIVVVTLFPFLYVAARSFSSERAVITGRVAFLPVEPSLRAYELAAQSPQFWTGYRNTGLYVAVSVVIHLSMTTIAAYPLSKRHLKGRGLITGLIVFTMFFGGGLIPTYLLIRSLGLMNSLWALVLPNAIQVWHLVIMRTFFQSIPVSLEEAAQIDGLSPTGVLIRIVLPLSKPILATIALFVAVGTWNDWFSALIYLQENKKYPLTLYLRNVVVGAQIAVAGGQKLTEQDAITPQETLRAATIMLVTVPILVIYPFVQKYFVQGTMVGSLKG